MDYLGSLIDALASIMPISSGGLTLFLVLGLGSIIGGVVGVIPGIGGVTAMVLAIPFLYSVDPKVALVFLVAVSAVTATAGDLTSVLFGIPGVGTTAATVVDGHKMTAAGEGGRAVFAAMSSSLVGAVFGAAILAVMVPVVKPLVLSVASPEQFMLVLFAITYISALSRENLSAGLFMGAIGLLLSTAGLDPTTAEPRLIFEPLFGSAYSIYLIDGVSIVAASLGLFSIPAIIDIMQSDPARTDQPPLGSFLRVGMADLRTHFGLILRSSAIGTYIGLLPGIGGSVAQWVAYAHASRTAPRERPFGEGAVEGVIAPGAANNSKEGGSLVPTLAFGVPGSLSTTILLAAFTLFGITPGVNMLDPDKNLELTYSLVWVIVISNVIVVGLVILLLPQLVRLAQAPRRWLVPFLVLFTIIGAYSVRSSLFDVGVAMVFGALGLAMRWYRWPRPPLLLGLVLGGVAESSLHIAFNAYGASWLLRPGVLVIGFLMAAAIVWRIANARVNQ